MSFSERVKHELCSKIPENGIEGVRSRLFAMFLCFRKNLKGGYIFKTDNIEIVEYFIKNLSDQVKDLENFYSIDIGKHNITLLIKDKISIQSYLCNSIKEDVEAILSGIFLAVGSFSEPNKAYRLDFNITTQGQEKLLSNIIREVGYTPLFCERNGFRYLYIKESDAIEEILTAMGADDAAMEIMNVKIYKNMRNTANRITNCETANIQKTVIASTDIINKINKILDVKHIDFIGADLIKTAELRVNNPEMSLKELSELFSPPISRSGLNHRLKKLSKIADDIEEGEKKHE